MPDLTPITREEMFLDGNTELTPITREEMILAGADIDVITRREWFLKKYRSGGNITVEPITITENGTTTAPSGKAYSPIYTNVGLPENAYLLKDIPNTPCDIATFTDGSNLPMPNLKVSIEPLQSGSGDPSPSNVRPISGWSAVDVTKCGKNLYGGIDFANSVKDASPSSAIDTTNKTVTYSYGTGSKTTIFDTFKPLTSYTFLFKVADCGGQNFSMRIVYTDGTSEGIEILPSDIGNYVRKVSNPNKTVSKLAVMWYHTILVKLYYDECGIFEGTITAEDYEPYAGTTTTIPFTDAQGNPITVYGGECDVVNGTVKPNIEYDSYNGETLVGRWISDRDVYAEGTTPTIGAQVVDLGAYGSDISVQPTSIKSLEGVNNVWADCGQILEGEYFSKEA